MGNACVTSKVQFEERNEILFDQRTGTFKGNYTQKFITLQQSLGISVKPQLTTQYSRRMDDGSYYEGDKESINYYKGKLKSKKGEYYEGIFKNKQVEGYGKFQRKDGLYVGQWKQGQQHGKGKDVWNDRSYYQGTYLNGLKHGKGLFKFEDGSYYDGDWVADKMDGYVYQQGCVQMEKWLCVYRNGKGIMVYPFNFVNIKYEGNYVNDQKEGYGELTSKNGKYTGQFHNDVFHGQGKMVYKNGSIQEGQWQNGKFIG